MSKVERAQAAAQHFEIDGELIEAQPFGSGHINDTFRVMFRNGGGPFFQILQRINHHIFKNPDALMQNIQRVTAHLASQVAGAPDHERRVLHLIPARNGSAWHVDDEGEYWRAYDFISGARTFDAVENAEQAFQAARAFGRFQELLASMPPPRLHDTIPDFHNTPKRFEALLAAISADSANRAILAQPEIEFALVHESIAGILLNANLPERVTHNDTKFNNVMLDDRTGEGLCVVDLDTVMPGLAPYDFGDMVRTTTSPTAEDEQDLSKVTMQFPMFEALVRKITDAASRIGHSDLMARVPTNKRNDEVSRLAETLNGMLDRIESSMHQLHTITDSLAHDLRSPLTAIRGKLEMSLSGASDGEQGEQIVSAIEELDRLTDFLNKSLDVAEARADALRLTRSPIDLCELLRAMVDLYEPSMSERGLRVNTVCHEPVEIDGDAALIHRMVANLLDNELKHLPQNCSVNIELRATNGSAELILEDDGPGFDPEVLEHAFERRVKGRESDGHGLGLAFIDAVTRAHGGEVTVSNRKGGGARIKVTLPVGPAVSIVAIASGKAGDKVTS